MRGILEFFRQNPVLGFIVAISILLLNIGIWILRNPAPAPVEAAASGAAQLALEVPSLPEMGEGGQNVESLQTTLESYTTSQLEEFSKLSPAELQKAIAAAEPGSELWCDLLLVKPDNAWTDEDAATFSRHCI